MNLDLEADITFILGAGASHPYGFPIGKDLKRNMAALVTQSESKRMLANNGFTKELIDSFSEALHGTTCATIDTFLEKKAKYRDIGSYLIAYVLLPAEDHHNLFPPKDWYHVLYKLIGFEDKPGPKISVVTLNYDRSLEHFLTRNIVINGPDQYEESAKKRLAEIEIVHAHGSLGKYPSFRYGQNGNINDATLQIAAKGIKIISDHLDDSEDFIRAQEIIRDSSQIIFLGFGFDPRTLELLFKKTDENKASVFASAYDFPGDKRKIVHEFLGKDAVVGSAGHTAEAFLQLLLNKANELRSAA